MSRRAISLATASLHPSVMKAAENLLAMPGAPDVLLRHEGDAVLVLTTHDGIDELEEHWSRII